VLNLWVIERPPDANVSVFLDRLESVRVWCVG